MIIFYLTLYILNTFLCYHTIFNNNRRHQVSVDQKCFDSRLLVNNLQNTLFEKVLKATPAKNTALTRLMEFKILLCKKKLGLNDEVTILAEKYDFLDDSPFYYYAQAALAYDEKNTMKAEEWLAIASRVFQDPNVLAPWQDTLVEYGYIKSFYGDESAGDDVN